MLEEQAFATREANGIFNSVGWGHTYQKHQQEQEHTVVQYELVPRDVELRGRRLDGLGFIFMELCESKGRLQWIPLTASGEG